MKEIEIIKDILEKDASVRLAILYGSFASGMNGAMSDIDLAVAGEGPFDTEKLAGLNLALSAAAGREVDLLDLNTAGGMILTEVLTTGERLKMTDEELYVGLIRKMHYFQADMAPNIRYILDKRREAFLLDR